MGLQHTPWPKNRRRNESKKLREGFYTGIPRLGIHRLHERGAAEILVLLKPVIGVGNLIWESCGSENLSNKSVRV